MLLLFSCMPTGLPRHLGEKTLTWSKNGRQHVTPTAATVSTATATAAAVATKANRRRGERRVAEGRGETGRLHPARGGRRGRKRRRRAGVGGCLLRGADVVSGALRVCV